MKKINTLITAMLILSTSFSSSAFAAASTSFTDINGHTYEREILSLANKGIIKGYTDGTYKPDALIMPSSSPLVHTV